VDIGGTKLFGVTLASDGDVVAEARLATPHLDEGGHGDGSQIGSDVADAVAELVGRLSERPESATRGRLAVGVGAPGMVDRLGVLRFAPNLASASGADLRRLVAERLPQASVVVENDANCAALGELAFGALHGVDQAVMITLGTGIGGGLVAGGQLRTGAYGFAAEIGHMIVDPAGPPCPCGRRGCWERYASGGGLGRLAREAAFAGRLPHVVAQAGGDPENVHGEDITRAALRGDGGALGVLEELGWWVALGLANVVAMVDPERIVLGGGLAEAKDLLLQPTRRAFDELVEGAGTRPGIEIVGAALGERAGAVGAALAARGEP
jgi:glucokinase